MRGGQSRRTSRLPAGAEQDVTALIRFDRHDDRIIAPRHRRHGRGLPMPGQAKTASTIHGAEEEPWQPQMQSPLPAGCERVAQG